MREGQGALSRGLGLKQSPSWTSPPVTAPPTTVLPSYMDLGHTDLPCGPLCPLVPWSHPCLLLGSWPFWSSPAPSCFSQSRPGHTQLFVPRPAWGMKGRFCPWLYKAICAQAARGKEGAGVRRGGHGVGQKARQTQPHSLGRVSRQLATCRLEPRAGGCSRRKELAALVGVPKGFIAECLCHQLQPPLLLPFSPVPLLRPHPALWDEKTPLFGVFAIMMKAVFFLLRIHLCIPEGALITPCPGCRHVPPSDPPAQKGGLVRHMKPVPLDMWTRRGPLAEHEAVLNATDS